MRGRIVPELDDAFVTIQGRLNDAALDAASASMNEADFGDAGICGGVDVLDDNGGDVARREGVEVEFGFDWNDVHADWRL